MKPIVSMPGIQITGKPLMLKMSHLCWVCRLKVLSNGYFVPFEFNWGVLNVSQIGFLADKSYESNSGGAFDRCWFGELCC